jgi:hypothetical protein
MKKQIVILLLLPIASAYSALVPLTPGGFDTEVLPWPAPFINFIERQINGNLLFFDDMSAIPWYDEYGNEHPPGWVSRYGILNGGTYFFCHIDQTGPVPKTTISWDMTGSGFYMAEIYVDGYDGEGHLTALYGVPQLGMLTDRGSVTIDRVFPITTIGFYGTDFLRHPRLTQLPRHLYPTR